MPLRPVYTGRLLSFNNPQLLLGKVGDQNRPVWPRSKHRPTMLEIVGDCWWKIVRAAISQLLGNVGGGSQSGDRFRSRDCAYEAVMWLFKMAASKWSYGGIEELITEYEKYPWLYNTKLKDYKNRDKKRAAFIAIATAFGKSGELTACLQTKSNFISPLYLVPFSPDMDHFSFRMYGMIADLSNNKQAGRVTCTQVNGVIR